MLNVEFARQGVIEALSLILSRALSSFLRSVPSCLCERRKHEVRLLQGMSLNRRFAGLYS